MSATPAKVERTVRQAGDALRDASDDLVNGVIGVKEWHNAAIQELTLLHARAAATAAKGEADDPDIRARLDELLDGQFRFLEQFAADIRTGSQPLDGTVAARAEMYTKAARGTFQEVARAKANAAGFTRERRVLGGDDHCGECVALAAQGWQPVGTLPAIGSTTCLTNCRCHFEYDKGEAAEFAASVNPPAAPAPAPPVLPYTPAFAGAQRPEAAKPDLELYDEYRQFLEDLIP